MSLLVYECQRAEHGHEIRQFGEVARRLQEYYDGRKETALLIGNVNIGPLNLDGLIIKEDAIIILELKDRSGKVVARVNGDWTCDNEVIKGGGHNKTVFEQLKVNRRELKKNLADGKFFTPAQIEDIQGLVVFSDLIECVNELDRENKQWVHIADVGAVGQAMHDIKARAYIDYRTHKSTEPVFTAQTIFGFIRQFHLPESALVTDLSDTHLLPSDLFHEDAPHNGKMVSTATLLEQSHQKIEILEASVKDIQRGRDELELEYKKAINEKDSLINQTNAELVATQDQLRKTELDALEAMGENELAQKKMELMEGQLSEAGKSLQMLQAKIEVMEKERTEEAERQRKIEEALAAARAENERLRAQQNEQPVVVPPPQAVAPPSATKPVFGAKKRTSALKAWDVSEGSMDDDQLDIIRMTRDKSMLVAGCAGCGKSVIAMNKAIEIKRQGGDVILIALTKALSRYMSLGAREKSLGSQFFYHWQWLHAGKPAADYVLVDEIQDFTREEIADFMAATRKHFFFFGDTAQSIYRVFKRNTLSIDQIAEMTGLHPLYLYNNYRLPRGVAKITQPYVGVDVNPYSERIYQSKERTVPHFIACANLDAQAEVLAQVLATKQSQSVGILLPNNEAVAKFSQLLTALQVPFEYKYSPKKNIEEGADSLDFCSECPKVMTYHSAKGLQFETVFLPAYEGARTDDERKALYVAMTRTWRDLFVFYCGEFKPPLANVPSHLYLKK